MAHQRCRCHPLDGRDIIFVIDFQALFDWACRTDGRVGEGRLVAGWTMQVSGDPQLRVPWKN